MAAGRLREAAIKKDVLAIELRDLAGKNPEHAMQHTPVASELLRFHTTKQEGSIMLTRSVPICPRGTLCDRNATEKQAAEQQGGYYGTD